MSQTFSMITHAGGLFFFKDLQPTTGGSMKNVPAPLSCAIAAHPGLAYLFFPLIALTLLLFAWPDLADAKRMGGGGSFGSKPSYNSGYNKQAPPAKDSPAMAQQAAPNAPSRFGGLGGMFGGLLMGGLLGSMLFGGGGFAGPGMLDMLLLAVGGFLLFKFIKSRRAATANSAPYAYAGNEEPRDSTPHGGWGQQRLEPQTPQGPVLPKGLDEQEFLTGAKALYTRLQASWDRRDIDDIRQFTSPEVHEEIARQATLDPEHSRTEILMLEARILEARSEGTETVISVLLDAMLREDGPSATAEQVREVWHIRRDESASPSQWTLEGIQQLTL
jgi:predicted lipid-binding transport protein (Tim44 family)